MLTDDARAFVESETKCKKPSNSSFETKIILKKDETAYYSEQSKLLLKLEQFDIISQNNDHG